MARKHATQPADACAEAGSIVPASLAPGPADAGAEAVVAAHLAQAQPKLAAAALLPILDAAAAAGHGPCGLAAALLRWPEPPADARTAPDDEQLAAAVHRLTALLRQQDGQMARLQDMLDGLL